MRLFIRTSRWRNSNHRIHLLRPVIEEGGKGPEMESQTLQGQEPFRDPSWWLPWFLQPRFCNLQASWERCWCKRSSIWEAYQQGSWCQSFWRTHWLERRWWLHPRYQLYLYHTSQSKHIPYSETTKNRTEQKNNRKTLTRNRSRSLDVALERKKRTPTSSTHPILIHKTRVINLSTHNNKWQQSFSIGNQKLTTPEIMNFE